MSKLVSRLRTSAIRPSPDDDDEDDISDVSSVASSIKPDEEPEKEKVTSKVEESASGEDDSLDFYFEIGDGHSFRQFVDFMGATLTSIPFYISKDRIIIQQGNGSSQYNTETTFVGGLEIDTHRLLNFYYNEERCGESMMIPLKMKNLRERVKQASKKDSIRFLKYSGEDEIFTQIHSANKKGGLLKMKVDRTADISGDYDFSGLTQAENMPNCRILLPDFCAACSSLQGATTGTTMAVINCYPRGMEIYGANDSGPVSDPTSWGECLKEERMIEIGGVRVPVRNPKKAPGITINVSKSMVKAMVKMRNFAQNSILNVYCERSGIIRLTTYLGYYGNVSIYLIKP
jgi:hypothetical protein